MIDSQVDLSSDLKAHIDHWCEKFPSDQRRSAVVAALLQAQEENHGYLTGELMNAIAAYLGIPPIEVFEVATFYDMFEFEPVGNKISVCTNVSCMLRGVDALLAHVEEKLGIKIGQTTDDKKFTLERVECLAACDIAPVCQINNKEQIGHLTPEKMDQLIDQLSEEAP